MKIKIPLSIFLLALLSAMCVVPNLDTEYFATVEPAHNNLCGRYIPTKETRDFIQTEGNYDAKDPFVELFSDGTFEMQGMPDWWLTDFGEPGGCLISGNGTWTVVKHQNWWNLELNFSSGKNLCLEKYSSGLNISIPIAGNEYPYRLWFYVGDPDSGNVMIFDIDTQ